MSLSASKKPVVLIGVGEMGGVFARGLLKMGYPIYPVNRETDMQALSEQLADPQMVLLAVGEKDLHPSLEAIPTVWRDKLALLQNELLPRDWQQHQLDNPTVISVWFEKKPGQDAKVIIPSPSYGPQAKLLEEALSAINIPVKLLDTPSELLFELVLKNLYILTTNIAGLEVGGDVEALWHQHRNVAESVAKEVLEIQQKLTGEQFDFDALLAGLIEAFEGDPQHQCMGRSAPARLQRAIEHANAFELKPHTLLRIQSNI